MDSNFNFVMIGAMYENGGNTTHRFLDGHPQLCVYPFESQPGTKLVNDYLSSTFPVKYRWPVFALDATPYQDYKAIIDEECKVRSRTPNVSKFRNWEFDFSDDERCEIYQAMIKESGRGRANNVAAFYKSTFEAWRNFNRTSEQSFYVGYSPIIGVDGDKILDDLPNAHVLHVVRNPWSAYADTKKRPVPMPLAGYMLGWTLNQYYALTFKQKYPDRFHIIRTEDTMANPEGVLGDFCEKLGIERSPTLGSVSWNSEPLKEVYPWGTIRVPTPEANRATANELSAAEKAEIGQWAAPYLEALDYKSFL